MAHDPAFLFYTNDFSTGTQFLSDEQLGKYLRLLMAQHQHGHLSDIQVNKICKSYDNDVMEKFIKDEDGKWFNPRLELEIDKRRKYSESRGNNKRGKTIISKSYDNHMENRNKDVLDNNTQLVKNSKNGKSKNEQFSGNYKAQGEELLGNRLRNGIEDEIDFGTEKSS